MSKLNDTQAVLLASAAQRDSDSIYPLPKEIAAGSRLNTAIATLLSLSLVEERDTNSAAEVSRTDGDLRFGLFITPAGLEAIGVEPVASDVEQAPSPAAVSVRLPHARRRTTVCWCCSAATKVRR